MSFSHNCRTKREGAVWTAPSELEGENKVTKKTTKEVEYLRGYQNEVSGGIQFAWGNVSLHSHLLTR